MKRKRIDYEVEEYVKFKYLYNAQHMNYIIKTNFNLFKKIIKTYKDIFLKTPELKSFLVENIDLKITKLLIKYDHDLNISGLIDNVIKRYNYRNDKQYKYIIKLLLKNNINMDKILIYKEWNKWDKYLFYTNYNHIDNKILRLFFKYRKVNLCRSVLTEDYLIKDIIKYSKRYNYWDNNILDYLEYIQYYKLKINKYYLTNNIQYSDKNINKLMYIYI